MTALLVIIMTAPLWLGFGAIGWQVVRLTRRLRESRQETPEVVVAFSGDLTKERSAEVTEHISAALGRRNLR